MPPGNYNTLKRLADFCSKVNSEDECIDYLLSVSRHEVQEEWEEEQRERYQRQAKFSQTEFEVI